MTTVQRTTAVDFRGYQCKMWQLSSVVRVVALRQDPLLSKISDSACNAATSQTHA